MSKNADLRSTTGFQINSENSPEVVGNNADFFLQSFYSWTLVLQITCLTPINAINKIK